MLLFTWDIGICLSTDKSGYLLSRYRKLSVYSYLIIQHYYQVLRHQNCLKSGASCSPNRNRCVMSSIYSCVFYSSVFVVSSAGPSIFTLFHLGRMENDVNLYFLPNPFYFCPIYCYISLYLRISVCAYSRMDIGVKTTGRIFSDVVQIQVNTSIYSHFTALQNAHVNFADF